VNIHQRIGGSWSDHDAVRHYMYEGLHTILADLSWESRPYHLLEIGSAEPTSSVIRIVTSLIGRWCVPQVGNWPQVNIENLETYSDASVDLLVADQVLEHVQKPWLAAQAMRRVLVHGGLAVVATPYLHPIHLCPLDCWRISPDGYDVLFGENDWEVLGRGSWGNRAICQELYASAVSQGMTGHWVPYAQARQLLPSFDTPPDGLHPVVMWWVGRKR
jgi:SAM-dependent methyltransferase